MCPFLEKADPRCAACLSLHRLDEALGLCGDHYEDCPIYRKILTDDARNCRHYCQVTEGLRAAG